MDKLISSVSIIHHLPDKVINFVENVYADFTISIVTKRTLTEPISVERGVLQGDC
jgi:hypothetical protein